jgi:hypothetical protein
VSSQVRSPRKGRSARSSQTFFVSQCK